MLTARRRQTTTGSLLPPVPPVPPSLGATAKKTNAQKREGGRQVSPVNSDVLTRRELGGNTEEGI